MLPLLYLHGLSSGDFVPALSQFLGTGAGLSAPVITKLTEQWKGEAAAFMERDLSGTDYICVWADGIHVNVRLEEARLCLLVMIGVHIDGRKELIALADGHRESTESWCDLLRDCRRRPGMRAPVLAMGDGALGFWGALRDTFPGTREQRCWFHKIANVIDSLPKSAHPGAKKALAEIWNAENKHEARKAVREFERAYGAKFPKVTDCEEELLAFYDYPAEHWIHLRTTNPIESTFATVRHRTKVTKGPGSRVAGIAMVFKLVQADGPSTRRTSSRSSALARVRGRPAGRAIRTGQPGRKSIRGRDPRSGLRKSDPQVLTITRSSTNTGQYAYARRLNCSGSSRGVGID